MEYVIKNLLFLDASYTVELTILLVVIILIILSIICLTIIKKLKDKD